MAWRFRYGEIFKTHILGYPCIMLASPEACRSVLVTQADFFKPTYPKSKERLLGPSGLFFHQGDYHNRLRKLVQGSFSPEAIKNWVADIEAIAVSVTDSWAGGDVINTYHEMKKVKPRMHVLQFFLFILLQKQTILSWFMRDSLRLQFSFEVGIHVIFGHLEAHYKEELKKNYCIVERAYNSFPINIPGTPYKKALSVGKILIIYISSTIDATFCTHFSH